MIVFGFRRRSKRLGVIAAPCGNCASGQLVLQKVTRWFTLFFIPVVPVHFRHVTVCPNCKALRDVPRGQLEHMKSLLPVIN
ncbi:MAG: hypothetical protein ABSA31_06040 [Acidimicrobiales bacterium]|jgi:hypothetical protein